MLLKNPLMLLGCGLFLLTSCDDTKSTRSNLPIKTNKLELQSNMIGHWRFSSPSGNGQKVETFVGSDGYFLQVLGAIKISDRQGDDIVFEMLAKPIDCDTFDSYFTGLDYLDHSYKTSIGIEEIERNGKFRYRLNTTYKENDECLAIKFLSQNSSESGLEPGYESLKQILAIRSSVNYHKDRFGFHDWSVAESTKLESFSINMDDDNNLLLEKKSATGFFFLNPDSGLEPEFLIRERNCDEEDLNSYLVTFLFAHSEKVKIFKFEDVVSDNTSKVYRINYLFKRDATCVTLMISTIKDHINLISDDELKLYKRSADLLAESFSIDSELTSVIIR